MASSAGESNTEIDLEDSDENGEEDRPGRVCFVNMMVEEEHEEDTATFAYNGLLVPFNILFEQIYGFTLHPREGCTDPPITSMDHIPPDTRGLKKYFILGNPRYIEKHTEGVRRKADAIEVEPPT